jgi:hypothetical protein
VWFGLTGEVVVDIDELAPRYDVASDVAAPLGAVETIPMRWSRPPDTADGQTFRS